MNNKKILIVASEFPPMPGGIGSHAYHLAKELSDLKYDVTVLTDQREQNAGDWQKFLKANAEINIKGISRRRVVFYTYLSRLLHVFKLLRQTSYDAVIYSGKFSVWLNAVMPAAKSIAVIHGSEIKQKGFFKYLFERGLRKAKHIVCVSSYTKNQLLSNYENLGGGKIVVINNGFGNAWTNGKPHEKSADNVSLNLVTVGGIHRRKGQFNVVRALPEIVENFPGAKYHVIGLPVEKDELLDLINAQKVNNHVEFYHGASDLEVKDILNDSHVFMMLSEHLKTGDFEGFGIAVMEAMALGLPAIGTKDSGIADAVKDGYSGKLVDPKKPDEIITALKEIKKDYANYSANAKNWAKDFRWKNKIKEYKILIENL